MNIAPNAGKAVWLLTDKLTVKLASHDTDGAFALVEVVGQPELGPPPHIHHRQDECFCIQEGTFEFIVCEVVGQDEVGLPTSHLLMEHARLRDEAEREREGRE